MPLYARAILGPTDKPNAIRYVELLEQAPPPAPMNFFRCQVLGEPDEVLININNLTLVFLSDHELPHPHTPII